MRLINTGILLNRGIHVLHSFANNILSRRKKLGVISSWRRAIGNRSRGQVAKRERERERGGGAIINYCWMRTRPRSITWSSSTGILLVFENLTSFQSTKSQRVCYTWGCFTHIFQVYTERSIGGQGNVLGITKYNISSRDIAMELNIDRKTVLNHLHKTGYQKKLDTWVPHIN